MGGPKGPGASTLVQEEKLTLQLEAAEERLRVVLGLTDSIVFEIDAEGLDQTGGGGDGTGAGHQPRPHQRDAEGAVGGEHGGQGHLLPRATARHVKTLPRVSNRTPSRKETEARRAD